MNTISDYTIYCTPSQTKKSLELGANIRKVEADFNAVPTCYVDNSNDLYEVPTAEQMIGWLRTKGCTPYVYPVRRDGRIVLSARLLIKHDAGDSDSFHGFGEDYSIILAAIDAALEYLNNNK